MPDTPKRRGRPTDPNAKRNLTMRLSPDVIELIRAAPVARVEEVLRAGLTA